MARRKVKASSPPSATPICIGDFEVVDAKDFRSDSQQNCLQISLSKDAKICISVVEETKERGYSSGNESNQSGDCCFELANPNDTDDETKALLQEILNLYMKELPAMNYAANTGKQSMFLKRCLTSGKYCTLVLKSKENVQPLEIIASITYQIIPADTQYAEIPLAAVCSKFQHKGFGRMLYLELRKRLHSVGIRTLFCWGDKESEGFWLKQGFTVIGEVNRKGRASRLGIKADIRKSLCFPGDSTLMVSHLLRNSLSRSANIPPISAKTPELNFHDDETRHIPGRDEASDGVNLVTRSICSEIDKSASENLLSSGTKKRTWEASFTSLKSKKVKGTHSSKYQAGSEFPVWTSDGRIASSDRTCLVNSGNNCLSDACTQNSGSINRQDTDEECRAGNKMNEDGIDALDTPAPAKCIRIMLMNIADDSKKLNLTKVIEDLGGVVTSDGSTSTHIVTGEVRKTLNFCTALCSGSWIVSPGWLKESYKKGRFVDEMPFILEDEGYKTKYRTELKSAVLRAKANPNSLFKGLDIWLSTHVQPPLTTLAAIVKHGGGNVIWRLSDLNDVSKTICIACEEDMEQDLSTIKLGKWTFSADWLMNCIMRQELDLEAPQFAESL